MSKPAAQSGGIPIRGGMPVSYVRDGGTTCRLLTMGPKLKPAADARIVGYVLVGFGIHDAREGDMAVIDVMWIEGCVPIP